MLPVLVMISSAPRSPEARRALHLARTLHAQGRPVNILLLQDAVLAAVGGDPTREPEDLGVLVSRAVPVYACTHDLTLRGFAPQDVLHGVEPADDHRIVDLMLAEGTHLLGCF